jgi:hypothetical protein
MAFCIFYSHSLSYLEDDIKIVFESVGRMQNKIVV